MDPLQICAQHFAESHPNDSARLLELSSAVEGSRFLAALPDEIAARLLSQMSITSGADHLSLMEAEPAAALASQLPPNIAVPLLRRLSPEKRAAVLETIPQDSRAHLEQLLEYPDGTVGSVTDPEVLTIPSDFIVDEAQRLYKKRAGLFHHQLFVVDRARILLGLLHVGALFRAVGKTPVTDVMEPPTACLPAVTKVASALYHRAWAQIDAIPVVDNGGALLGIVRHRQLRRIQSIQQPSSFTSTLVDLSELYWIGLAKFLPGGVTETATSSSAFVSHVGGNDAA